MWISHPDLPDSAPLQIEDGSFWHYGRSGWVEVEAPTEPTTAELDALLLRTQVETPAVEAEPEEEPAADATEAEPTPEPVEPAESEE